MRRRAFLRGAAAVVGAAGRVRQGLGQSRGHEFPPGFALLRATQGEIAIAGQTAKVYHLLQHNGAQGYVGVKGQRFRVALVTRYTTHTISASPSARGKWPRWLALRGR